jgi:hypothetical protein
VCAIKGGGGLFHTESSIHDVMEGKGVHVCSLLIFLYV